MLHYGIDDRDFVDIHMLDGFGLTVSRSTNRDRAIT
jgi:hypothetical protein